MRKFRKCENHVTANQQHWEDDQTVICTELKQMIQLQRLNVYNNAKTDTLSGHQKGEN